MTVMKSLALNVPMSVCVCMGSSMMSVMNMAMSVSMRVTKSVRVMAMYASGRSCNISSTHGVPRGIRAIVEMAIESVVMTLRDGLRIS